MAEGIAPAETRPITPMTISKYVAFFANPATRLKTENNPRLKMRTGRRPNVSATFPKGTSKDPEVRLLPY